MKYLYQYTNLNALESILTNKTIRLRPLSTMDDMEEALSADCKAIGDFIFVSCWSEEQDEMIPMWYMYGSEFKGVRIGLPENPFANYTYSEAEQIGYGLIGVQGDLTIGISLEDILNPNYCVSPFHAEHFLKKVNYTDDSALLKPELWNNQNGNISFTYGKMGLNKNKYWSFQKEYRYILNILPINFKKVNSLILSGYHQAILQMMKDISNGMIKPPIEYYDLFLEPNMLDRMEIVLGPLMGEEDERKTREFIKGISGRILIKNSTLKGKIRAK